jgi:glycosyltransferase involved in cell wall biosynthesis
MLGYFLRIFFMNKPIAKCSYFCKLIVRIIRYEGLEGLWLRTQTGVLGLNQKVTKSFKRERLDLDRPSFRDVKNSSERGVSIIIPTKNGGSGFQELLASLCKQERFGDVEIIVVDSGSQDGTPELAEKFSAKVYRIHPDQFNHGLTRNLAAEKANGKYIVFTVQDAVPLNGDWLNSMICVLDSDSAIGAVTCRQFVRKDADLFARFMNHCQYVSSELRSDEVRFVENSNEYHALSPSDKRKISKLDNVCTCFKKEVFERYRFKRVKYAEDLEIGARLAMGGHKLAFLFSNGVVHSHNRSSIHFLKRGYTDRRLEPKFLAYDPPDPIIPKDITIQDIFSNMNELYLRSGNAIQEMKVSKNVKNVLFRCPQILIKGRRERAKEKKYTNEEMDNFLEEYRRRAEIKGVIVSQMNSNIFADGFILSLKQFTNYVSRNSIERENMDELEETILKLLGRWFGLYLGDIMNFAERRENRSIYRKEIDTFLSSGL